jgi:predicted P-loop ATPase
MSDGEFDEVVGMTDAERHNGHNKYRNGTGYSNSGRRIVITSSGELAEIGEDGAMYPFTGYRTSDDAPRNPNPQQAKSQSEAQAAAHATQTGKGDFMEGKVKWHCNVGNIALALEQEPEFMNLVGFDEMLRTEMLLQPLKSTDPNFKPRPLTDADVTELQARLQWFGFKRLGKDTTHDAVNAHARTRSFHPLRDYLKDLKWDGKARLRTWLHDYMGAEQNGYTGGIGTMFLIGMVARIFKPGCKLDYMPILEGGQGTFKSRACAILAGEYFTDHLPDITGKEASQHLRGKWLIEVAELRAYSRAMVDHFKEFLVRNTERYRPPFARIEISEPRQCAFIGTTNKDFYLRDETGARRFWPIKTGEIKLDELSRDRDRLLSEAVHLYRAGAPWWPDAEFEQQTIAPEQERRFEVDEWEPLIQRYLNALHEPKRTTIINIAVNVLGYETERPIIYDPNDPQPTRGTPINQFDKAKQMRVAAILRHLEWEPNRKERERWWQPGPKAKT